MAQRTPDELFKAFLADGNVLKISSPIKYIGGFEMIWKGGGCILEIGSDVTLSQTKLEFSKGGGTIRADKGVTLKGRFEVGGGGSIIVGEGTFFNRICDVRGVEGAVVQIGRNCLFSNVKVISSDLHSIIDIATGARMNPAAGIVIEDDVWFAEDVKVAKGVRIGTGSVIASGSLVTRSIPPLCIGGGRPAKVLRTGVKWSRALKKADPLAAPQFTPKDIPIDKEILRHLVAKGAYLLVEKAIETSGLEKLPLFARWYLAYTRDKLRRPPAKILPLLESVIAEAPEHSAARKLLEKLS